MSSASLDLQDVILNTLKADPTLMALVNGVWDQAPATCFAAPKAAYVSFGPHGYVEDDAECIVGGEHNLQLDVWSRLVGFPACKQICDRVKALLHEADLVIPTSNALASIRISYMEIKRDPDGLTSHGVLMVEARIEEQ